MKKLSKKTIVIGTSLILLMFIGIFYFSVQQSVFSVSKINVGNDGQVYWTWYGSASKGGETYRWTNAPGPYTFKDGSGKIVTPHNTIDLLVNPEQPTCNYALQSRTINYGFLGLSSANYYILNNPEKIVNVKFKDMNTGATHTLDGTTQTSVQFGNNGGKLTVETQGLLSGKFNCPNYANTVVVKFDNGQYGFYNQYDFKNYFSGSSILDTIFSSKYSMDKMIGQDSSFTNSFLSWPEVNNNKVVVGDIALGFPTFTITGNQKYFESTSYIPPKNAKPKITSIIMSSQIQESSQSSIVINFLNDGPTGLVTINPSSPSLSFSPSSANLNLGNSGSYSFVTNANSNVGSSSVTIKVCAVNQFSGNTNCDVKTKSFEITKKPAQTYCGDGTCQSNENKNTCPTDCNIIIPPNNNGTTTSSDTCGAWISMPKILGGATIVPDIGCEINNFFAPMKWIVAILLGLLSGIFGFKFLDEELIKKKKDKWISIVLGLAIAGSIGVLVFIYFWWGIASVIVLGIIKGVTKI